MALRLWAESNYRPLSILTIVVYGWMADSSHRGLAQKRHMKWYPHLFLFLKVDFSETGLNPCEKSVKLTNGNEIGLFVKFLSFAVWSVSIFPSWKNSNGVLLSSDRYISIVSIVLLSSAWSCSRLASRTATAGRSCSSCSGWSTIVADVLETGRTGGGPASFEKIFRSKDDDE